MLTKTKLSKFMKTTISILLIFICSMSYSQTTITGSVTDDSGQPLPGANIIIVGTSTGTVADFDGIFSLTVSQLPPFTIQASSVGFESNSAEISSNNQAIKFVLKEGSSLDEVIISASRTPERIFESPVTVERFGLKEIKSRKGKIIGIVTEGDVDVRKLADHVIEVPDTLESLSPLLTTIPLQLLSYHIAVLLGKNVDQPRNLAKSVTVE